MQFKDKDKWDKGLSKNQDFYGSAVYRYAEAWADLMENRMKETASSVSDVAKQASYDAANKFDISLAQYQCAVSILCFAWKYGDELRRWHLISS